MKKIFALILLSVSLFGAPAFQGEKNFKQNDASTFKGTLKGDEWFSWIETTTGYPVRYNPQSKNYEYVTLNAKDELIFSNVKVESAKAQGLSAMVSSPPKEIKKISSAKFGQLWKKAWQNGSRQRVTP